ncbi:MAG: GAP family protein [Kineosporiaceae bacterium]
MDLTLAGSLLVLALIDSTSIGTLLVPLWLLLAPGRVRAGRVVLFLATVAAFYLAVGLALVAGLAGLVDDAARLLEGAAAARLQLVVGAALLAGSFVVPTGRRGDPGGRAQRWRDRAMSGDGGVPGLVGLALVAAALEVATMLPYLGALGLVAASDLTGPGRAAVLTGYCLVMVVPALALTAIRLAARDRVEAPLRRLAGWLQRISGETLAWIVGIVGFLLARDAVVRLPELTAWLDR